MEYMFLGRFFLALTIILLHAMYLAMVIIIINFNIDSPRYNLDFFGITRLSKNHYFSICSVISCQDSIIYTLGFNIIVCSVLLFQNMLFINKDIRSIFNKRMLYDTLYYPKFIGRFVGCFSLLMMEMLYQPMNFEIYFIVDFSDYIRPIWFGIPFLIALTMLAMTMPYHYITNNELGGTIFMKLIKGTDIPNPEEYLFGKAKIYKSVRSPFRAGVMILLFFINPRWDYGRAAYFILFSFEMLAECINEEKYYFSKYDSYKKYMETVPKRFFNLNDVLSFSTQPKKKIETKTELKDETTKQKTS